MQSQAQLLGHLSQWFYDASNGGVACVLSGSPGAGKTHLVERFLEDLPESTPRLRGRGLQTGVAPFLPICEALRSYGSGAKLDKLRATAREFSQTVPWVKDIFGPMVRAHDRTRYAPLTLREVMPSETFTFVALSSLLAALENGERVVLFVDDIQWLDASSIAFLGYLAGQLRDRKMFLLLTYRSNGHVDDNARKLVETLRKGAVGEVHELSVTGLARTEQRELIQALLGPVEFADDEFGVLEASAQAKPYYLRELIQLLRDRGSIARVDGVWRFVDKIEPMLPPSRRHYVHHRVKIASDGQPLAGDLICLAACAGTEFDARLLATCVDKSVREVGAVLQQIEERSALIRRLGSSTKYRFDHDLTRDEILSELGEFARELHAQLAMKMAARDDVPPSNIAHQFEAAGEGQNAATWYLAAARHANIDAQFRSAIDYCESADRLLTEAGLPHQHAERIAVTVALGEALLGTEQYDEVVVRLEDRVVGVPPDAALPLLHILGRAEARVTEAALHDRAVEHLSAALWTLPEREDSLRAKIYTDLVNAHDVCGDYPASESAYKLAFAAARRANDQPSLVRLMRLSCIFWQPEKVVETIESAIVVAKRLHLDYELALCENNLGSAYLALHELGAAREHYLESDRLLQKLGGYRRDTPVNNLGVVKLFEGDIDAASALLHEALKISRDPHSILFTQSNLAAVEAMSGKIAESLSRFDSAVATADASGDLFYRDCIRHNLANALVGLGRFEQALEVLAATPLHHSHGEEILVTGKRAELMIRALEGAGQPVQLNLRQQVEALHRSTKPQAWLYRFPWYLCEIEFWED